MITYFFSSLSESLITAGLFISFFYLLFWVILKKRMSQRKFKKGEEISKQQFYFELKYSFLSLFTFTLMGTLLYWLDQKKMLSAYFLISDYGTFYWFGTIMFLFLFHDFWFYWVHRFLHIPIIFKTIHNVHHKSKSTSPLTSFSMHPLEAVIANGWIIPLAIFIPIHFPTFIMFELISLVLNILGHLGYEVYPKGFIKSIFSWKATATHHQIHHINYNKNYGLYFTFWDKWMSTESEKYESTFNELTDGQE